MAERRKLKDDSRMTKSIAATALVGFHGRMSRVISEAGGVTKLSNEMRTAPGRIYHWTRGAYMPNAINLAELALLTGVNLNWLLTGLGSVYGYYAVPARETVPVVSTTEGSK